MSASEPLEGRLQFLVQLCRQVPVGSTLILRSTYELSAEEVREVVDVMEAAVPGTEVVVLGPELSLEAIRPGADDDDASGHDSGRITDSAPDAQEVSL